MMSSALGPDADAMFSSVVACSRCRITVSISSSRAAAPCLNRPEMFSQLFMDSFTLMICSHLVGRYAQTHEAFPQFKGGLAPWQRRRVVDLFHEHLDGELRLETLADECGISVSHFARSFRRSFGTSAHRYLILKRVEIAKALLSETNNSLVDVAAQTGFSDQAAFTRMFANVVGATPAKWRREPLLPKDRHRLLQHFLSAKALQASHTPIMR